MTITIFHNPRCSKSRATLALLQENGIEPEVRLYLQDPPGTAELQDILGKLGMNPRQLMRKGEAEYKEQGLADESLDDTALLAAMAATPKLIERPIVLANDKAAIGRPLRDR